MTKLALVVPCYNEEECLEISNQKINEYLKQLIDDKIISEDSFILYVNDGSKDRTWEIIKKLHQENNRVLGISLSKNKGHQAALLCGLHSVIDHCDACISIDADLQDDINAIKEMVLKFEKGNDLVLGVRNSREKDRFLKRFSANMFYRFMQFLGAKTVNNHADFRLMSNRALKDLAKYSEVNLFLRGIILDIGYKVDYVYYSRLRRNQGKTKYSLKKMLSLATAGITSCSLRPIHLIIALGFFICFSDVLLIIYSIIAYYNNLFYFSYLALSIYMLFGITILAIGVVGEYVGRGYMEVKARPRYIISEKLINEEEKL